MIKEYYFKFSELVVNQQEIAAVLGYPDGVLPEPFDNYLQEVFNEILSFDDIGVTYRIIDVAGVIASEKVFLVEHEAFSVGKIIFNELKGSEQLVFFVSTAGKTISDKSQELLKGDNPVLGYVYDVVGSFIAEAACDKMQMYLNNDYQENGLNFTNRYSPGYCQWNVSDQHKLFSLFGRAPLGVELTDSALMMPVKSISGVIGMGYEVKYRDYLCGFCQQPNCVFRKLISAGDAADGVSDKA